MSENSVNSPLSYSAVIFDLDGVVTKTALVHAASWKEMFDEYLKTREKDKNEPFQEFDYHKDYLPYVDGKPRYKGVQSFLESRKIDIPFGDPSDSADQETACGLGNRKNVKFRELLDTKGVEVYESTIAFIKDLRSKDIRIGVASSSKNCKFVIESSGIDVLFETRVDGVISEQMGLHGKPEGDIFVEAAKNLGVTPDKSIIVEDAVSGVQAGVNGGFGLVIGFDSEDNADELKANGADVVIKNFEGIGPEKVNDWFINNADDHSIELT